MSFRQDGRKQRKEGSLIFGIETLRLARFAVSVLEPPAVKEPFKLGLGVDEFGQKNRRVSLNICSVKLLGPFHYPGDGETFLRTDSLKIRLNLI